MTKISIIDPTTGAPYQANSAYQGAGKGFGGELSNWKAPSRLPDAALLPNLKTLNSRADDLTRNHGIASGGVQLHVDHIVGAMFRLSLKPMWKRLGIDAADARAWARDVESAWIETAEDPDKCWLDAEGKRTFTMLIRAGIDAHTRGGEITSVARWLDRPGAPIKTAIKIISPHRISNPQGQQDTNGLRGGIEQDENGRAIAAHIQNAEYGLGAMSLGMAAAGEWARVPVEIGPMGRRQFLHVFEPMGDGQSRGSNAFSSIMSRLKMLDTFQGTQLQNAIVNAMYAAVIEAEMSSEDAFKFIGGSNGDSSELANYMTAVSDYHEGANITLGGARVAHLLPGEKLNLQRPGNSAMGFEQFEAAILRYISAGLNVSYEQLSRDYSKTNYSSARASMMESWRYFMGRRKHIAGRYASMIFRLWFEEALSRRIITLPRKANRGFYEAPHAWTNANWIGSGRIAIDGLKEVKEAVMRIEAGLSTYEDEMALLGKDYQDVLEQQIREIDERKAAGLPPPSWAQLQVLAPDNSPENVPQEA